MEYYGFEHIFHKYSEKVKATKAEEHDLGKIRDKFVEIVKLVGINDNLLCKHKDKKMGKWLALTIRVHFAFRRQYVVFAWR